MQHFAEAGNEIFSPALASAPGIHNQMKLQKNQIIQSKNLKSNLKMTFVDTPSHGCFCLYKRDEFLLAMKNFDFISRKYTLKMGSAGTAVKIFDKLGNRSRTKIDHCHDAVDCRAHAQTLSYHYRLTKFHISEDLASIPSCVIEMADGR
jgi:hypothetical protein